jgi:hypothetical protein
MFRARGKSNLRYASCAAKCTPLRIEERGPDSATHSAGAERGHKKERAPEGTRSAKG